MGSTSGQALAVSPLCPLHSPHSEPSVTWDNALDVSESPRPPRRMGCSSAAPVLARLPDAQPDPNCGFPEHLAPDGPAHRGPPTQGWPPSWPTLQAGSEWGSPGPCCLCPQADKRTHLWNHLEALCLPTLWPLKQWSPIQTPVSPTAQWGQFLPLYTHPGL